MTKQHSVSALQLFQVFVSNKGYVTYNENHCHLKIKSTVALTQKHSSLNQEECTPEQSMRLFFSFKSRNHIIGNLF